MFPWNDVGLVIALIGFVGLFVYLGEHLETVTPLDATRFDFNPGSLPALPAVAIEAHQTGVQGRLLKLFRRNTAVKLTVRDDRARFEISRPSRECVGCLPLTRVKHVSCRANRRAIVITIEMVDGPGVTVPLRPSEQPVVSLARAQQVIDWINYAIASARSMNDEARGKAALKGLFLVEGVKRDRVSAD
jgi:hypothetical protein